MARKLSVLFGMFLVTCVLRAREAEAQVARYEIKNPIQKTAKGARYTNFRLIPMNYNRVHLVLAQGTTGIWNALKQHPPQVKILRDLGTHEVTPNQVKEMNLDIDYGGEVQSGTKGVLAARFFTAVPQGQPTYIHVFGGSGNDTELTLP